MRKIIPLVFAALLIIALFLVGCSTKGDDVIQITHKDYTEQRITGQLLSVYLESKGFETEVTELSGTMLCYTALRQGEVDVYAEFTGSAYGAILDQTEIIGVQETYDYVKQRCEDEHGITWLKPLGWNNTYVLSVRPETQEEYGLTDISSLIAVAPELVMGCDDEFLNRADGLPGLKEFYPGLEFKDEIPMDQGLTYAALRGGELDINVSYSTDGRIAKFGLVNLEDNKNFFPPYYVTPILRMDYAEDNPKIVEALNELGGHWSDTDMQKYNLMVDEGQNARDVATLMLQDAGLID
ncbi:MAG: glycine/betaine ABC transporter substrate-binding protein [Clostridia bacterium]|nr:glycine/betaine ABC transporter substrate-binding protein [Clostridia bacterium]